MTDDDPPLNSSHSSVDGEDPSPGSITKLQPDDDIIQDSQDEGYQDGATIASDEIHDQTALEGHTTSPAEDQQEKPAIPSSRIEESDKDIKAREKRLRVAEAVAPPPPSMSSLLSTDREANINKEHETNKSSSIHTASTSGVRSSTSSDANSKRAAAAGGSMMKKSSSSSGSQQDRNPLRYSTDHHVAKHAKARGQQPAAAGPGAVPVGDVEQAKNDTQYYSEAVPLTAEAVDDSQEEENIRELRQSNEVLRKQVQQALENERTALVEMQTMAQAPPANVAVVMGDAATATSVLSESPPESRPSTPTERTTKCCWNLAKGTVFFAGCCCIFCVILIVVVFFAVGLDNIIVAAGDDAEDVVQGASRRSNLQALLQDLEPLHEEAFDWLVNIDQWDPELRNATTAPSDQTVTIDDIGNFVDRITNADGGSSVGTGPRKWMFVERYYLAVLYFSTNGDNWKQNFGWMSETNSHCSEGAKKWFGIQCENDYIVSIELETNNLDGSFPKEIRVLRNLRSIWMSGDGFVNTTLTGTIPTMPGNLTQIWLWNMRMDGSLPEQLFELSGLTSLRLYQNQFTGAVPSNIIQLSDLQTLELVGNQLTGTIPVLPNVTSCDLSSNKFANTTNGADRGCVVFDKNP